MKRKTKMTLGVLVWLGIGLFSMVLGWEHFLTYTTGTYVYITFVLPFEGGKDE